MYCTEYEETSCKKKMCCKMCEEEKCTERCDSSEECDGMTEKEPLPLEERYEEESI